MRPCFPFPVPLTFCPLSLTSWCVPVNAPAFPGITSFRPRPNNPTSLTRFARATYIPIHPS
jgi:hypothetical protein